MTTISSVAHLSDEQLLNEVKILHAQRTPRDGQHLIASQSRAWLARSAPKASSEARHRCLASPAPGRISPQRQSPRCESYDAGPEHRRARRPSTDLREGCSSLFTYVKGEILELKNTINTMVDQLNAFAAEVTRVAREVGTDGKLGRSGPGAGCRRHLEEFHRLGQRHGRQPHPGAHLSKVATHRLRRPEPKITADVSGEIL